MDVCAVKNSGNSFSFPLEARVRINLTAVHVNGQACASCSCQSITEEFSSCFHTFEVSRMKIIVDLRDSRCNKQICRRHKIAYCANTVDTFPDIVSLLCEVEKNISRYLRSRGGQDTRRTNSVGFYHQNPPGNRQ